MSSTIIEHKQKVIFSAWEQLRQSLQLYMRGRDGILPLSTSRVHVHSTQYVFGYTANTFDENRHIYNTVRMITESLSMPKNLAISKMIEVSHMFELLNQIPFSQYVNTSIIVDNLMNCALYSVRVCDKVEQSFPWTCSNQCLTISVIWWL